MTTSVPVILSPDALAIVFFFTVANERIVEYLLSPLFVAQKWNTKWLMYVALVTGFALGIALTPQVFMDGIFFSPWVGKILTGILIGGGSNLLHQVTMGPQVKPDSETTPEAPKPLLK